MSTVSSSSLILNRLLDSVIDYAGLFPPASLSMTEAIASYALYLRSRDRPSLGRFVVPAVRLAELEAGVTTGGTGGPWSLSVTLGESPEADASALTEFGNRAPASLVITAIEGKVADATGAARLASMVPAGAMGYGELAWSADFDAMMTVLSTTGLAAKARLGGTVATAFPEPERVVAFLEAAIRAGRPFKATAGLHHPWRGEYRLTYEPGSPTAVMYGYLNVMLAGLLLFQGEPAEAARAVLVDPRPDSLAVGDGSIRWRGRTIDLVTVTEFRKLLFHGFGSCSFREPIDELEGMVSA